MPGKHIGNDLATIRLILHDENMLAPAAHLPEFNPDPDHTGPRPLGGTTERSVFALLTIRSSQTQLDVMTHTCTRRCAVECLVMLSAAFVILGVAVLLGSVLAALHLQTESSTPPWSLAVLHGLLAVGGLSCLALALRGPPRGLDQGVASFGIIATSLITLAALIGVALLATRIFKTRIAGMMIGIHATLAVSGFVVLAAYVLLG